MIYKASKQRDLVLNYMRNIHGHVSAEQIFYDLNKQKNISLATVYRNLNILAEMNEIKKIAHPTYGYMYDKTCLPHYHFYCIECHELSDLDINYLDNIDHIPNDCGHDINEHVITFTGTCRNCLNKKKKEN